MSFGIVRVQKMSSGSVKGIEIHDRREKEGISHTNKNIVWERTKLNYDLHFDQNVNFKKAVKEKIQKLNLPKAVRKDAVVLAQVLVTSDNGFFKNLSNKQQEQFFKNSYEFLKNRYGTDNIISATVHLDEKTPHMHFNFVPITTDGRLSAKSILTRQRLIEQQTAFYEQVGKKYGLERGLQGGSSKHLEISELKACTAEANADTAYNIYKDLQEQAEALQSDYEAKKAYVDDLDLENAEINDLNYQNIILKNENEKLKNENFNLKEKLNWLIDKIKNLELFQEFKRLFEPQKTKKKSRDRER